MTLSVLNLFYDNSSVGIHKTSLLFLIFLIFYDANVAFGVMQDLLYRTVELTTIGIYDQHA